MTTPNTNELINRYVQQQLLILYPLDPLLPSEEIRKIIEKLNDFDFKRLARSGRPGESRMIAGKLDQHTVGCVYHLAFIVIFWDHHGVIPETYVRGLDEKNVTREDLASIVLECHKQGPGLFSVPKPLFDIGGASPLALWNAI